MINPEELGFEVSGYSGDEAVVKCPYHSDHRPSGRFNVQTGLFYCFVCGVGKRAEEIARDLGGMISDTPIATPRIEPEPIDWRGRFLPYPLAMGNKYLRTRQVPEIAIRKLQIRHYDDGIIFPLFSSKDGDISGVQVRQYVKEPKYLFYGKRPAVYPMIGLPISGDLAILVEGVFSVIRGRSAGFETFAVMGASALSGALKFFFDRTRVCGIFDPDEAGYIASAKLAAVGIACLKVDFEADEMSIDDWQTIIPNRANFTMDVGTFVTKAVKKGGKHKTIVKQILKFEKENSV